MVTNKKTKDTKVVDNLTVKNNEAHNNKPKCFVIMPFSSPDGYAVGHFDNVYKYIIKVAVEKAGFEPIRVNQDKISDNLLECEMAVCDLSSCDPNVMYELGIRQAFDKKVVLIQDDKTDKIFDVAGISTIFYKSERIYEDVLSAQDNIKNAIEETYKSKNNISLMSVLNLNPADRNKKPLNKDDEIMILLRSIFIKINHLEYDSQNQYRKHRLEK